MKKIELYTDGGCRENGQSFDAPGGIGCVLLIPDQMPIYLRERLKFQPNTNNKAEIYAVIRGLDMLYKNYQFQTDFIKDELIIYSDSAYMINGITNWINGWRANGWITSTRTPVKNKELWQTLDNMITDLKQNFDIKFIKVKGHSGNKWNEECDRLANEAMNGMI